MLKDITTWKPAWMHTPTQQHVQLQFLEKLIFLAKSQWHFKVTFQSPL